MKVYFDTLGCPKNEYDSETAAGLLENGGHTVVDDPYEADAIVVNTCGFICDAKQESIDRIFEMASLGKLLVATGCLTQRYGETLFEEMPEVDIFLGVNDYERLPEILDRHVRGEREKYLSPYTEEPEIPFRKLAEGAFTATLKIAEGCDNTCTFCAIPGIRGPYRSRPKKYILEEAQRLAAAGVKELVLIAQDTTAWGIDLYGEYRLHELLRELCEIEGIEWIRIMYAYEDRITAELIEVMRDEEKICKYLDIPLQHISDRILRRMARRSTADSICETIATLRHEIPDIHIRTTLITGFPGETEQDFTALRDFVNETRFERLGVFAFSPEDGTPAAEFDGQIEDDVKEARKDAIMRGQVEISLEVNQGKIGQELTVLLEEQEEEGTWLGRTEYDAPEIDCTVVVSTGKEHSPGDMIRVKIEDAFDYDLIGREI